MRIGLISDTHGLLRPEAMHYLQGSDCIVHAGDIGDAEILEQLASIAPVTAVRGNNDKGVWADALEETRLLMLGNIAVYVLHDLAALDFDLHAAGVRVVVAGHSHRPSVSERHGIVYVNPGSAGRRRFSLPVSAGELHIDGDSVSARTLELDVTVARGATTIKRARFRGGQ
jgi:putative phosphoesterase